MYALGWVGRVSVFGNLLKPPASNPPAVNVDMMDQMELIDVSDQEALDVFFSSSGEEGSMTSPLPGMETRSRAEIKIHFTHKK